MFLKIYGKTYQDCNNTEWFFVVYVDIFEDWVKGLALRNVGIVG